MIKENRFIYRNPERPESIRERAADEFADLDSEVENAESRSPEGNLFDQYRDVLPEDLTQHDAEIIDRGIQKKERELKGAKRKTEKLEAKKRGLEQQTKTPIAYTELPENIKGKIDEAVRKMPDKIALKAVRTENPDAVRKIAASSLSTAINRSILRALDVSGRFKSPDTIRWARDKIKKMNLREIVRGAKVNLSKKDKRSLLTVFVERNT
ncbi:hypothetical protein GF366_00235 [Candidatus Peregrinibacteria bacterium]|nr:hypothetical protein [Candidatus Peregrinibacteria bacterium]